MTRVLTLLTLVLFAGLAAAAPVPKALKAKPLEGQPFAEVATKLERRTRLACLSRHPVGVSLVWPDDPELTADEVFDNLNEQLVPRGYILVRKTQSFRVEVVGR